MASTSIFPHSPVTQVRPKQMLSIEVQRHITENFWPASKSSLAEFAAYFKYFQWAIEILPWPETTIDVTQFAAHTYGDVVKVVKCMSANCNDSRLVIAEKLESDFPGSSRGQILRSMELTARLWLTLHVRSRDFSTGPSLSDVRAINWDDAISLKKMISDSFPVNTYLPEAREARIDPSFTIVNLRRLCRIKVQWTANLKDHLSYNRSVETIYVYPHKICLISHLESCDILPKDLLHETIRTLDLLFPFGDEKTQKWLDDSGQAFYRTSSQDMPRATDLGEFRFWRKRLVELYDVFNRPPRSILQMWHDRRNPMQWWTFWLAALIAFMTIVFGVISSYTGFKQTTLAEQAYRLSLMQTCSQSTAIAGICEQ
jgi:hypothetical protein